MNQPTTHILVVDDEPHNLEIIEEFLDDEGYTLHTAEDGQVAFEILQASPDLYDLILLDIMMPNMTGLELLVLLKKHEQLKDIPVILQTARGDSDDIVKGINAGAYYYLTKPFEDDILCSIVKTALRDVTRYKELSAELDSKISTFHMMQSGSFFFRTLDEAKTLSHCLALSCPDPQSVIIGLSELFINAIEHGNLGLSYADKTRLLQDECWINTIEELLESEEHSNKFVTVQMERGKTDITFTITDQGKGFDWQPYLQIDPARGGDSHGRGIAMAGMLSFSNIEYQGNGNQVVATISTH